MTSFDNTSDFYLENCILTVM